jgi:DNA-binding NtrC family response regulator
MNGVILKKVLIIEDAVSLQYIWSIQLADKVEIISALTVTEAEEKFVANPDICLVAIDACLSEKQINTIPLVKKIRCTFFGPMIAMSGNDNFRLQLLKAGCDYECGNKQELPTRISEIIEPQKLLSH